MTTHLDTVVQNIDTILAPIKRKSLYAQEDELLSDFSHRVLVYHLYHYADEAGVVFHDRSRYVSHCLAEMLPEMQEIVAYISEEISLILMDNLL